MAKDRSKRAWSINRANATVFPKPAKRQRHGGYQGTGGSLIEGRPTVAPPILYKSRQGLGYDNFYDAPRVRPQHEPFVPNTDPDTGLPCVKRVAKDRQHLHNPNRWTRYRPEPHVIKPSKRRHRAP